MIDKYPGLAEDEWGIPQTTISIEVNQVEALEMIDWLAEASRKAEWVPPMFDELEQSLSDFVYKERSA